MADNSELIGLTPLDHLPAKIFLPYVLYFDTTDTKTALHTIQNGVDKLISLIPWLAGDVVLRNEPSGPQNRAHIVVPPRTAAAAAVSGEIPMVQVKYFDRDDEFRTHRVQAYVPVPTFIPASQGRPVVRFQANIFPSKIALVMSFMHMVFDGSGAGVLLQALAECCKAAAAATDDTATDTLPITQTIAANDVELRKEISTWPSKCQTRLDHSVALGPPAFDPNLSAEQWGAMESTMLSAGETQRITFSTEKVAAVKAIVCDKLLPRLQHTQDTQEQQSPSSWISSNDIIAATLSITVNRTLRPERTESAGLLMAVDLRKRVRPPLPETYLGNVIYPIRDNIYPEQTAGAAQGEAATGAGEEETDPDADLLQVTQLSLRLRAKLNGLDETIAYSAAAAVADGDDDGDWSRTDGQPADIVLTSWRHLNVFALDFGPGLGHIEDFGSGFFLLPGACIFMPARTTQQQQENGSEAVVPWEVCITLKPGGFEGLMKDPLFSRIVA